MSAGTVESQPRGSAEFVESSVLEAIVPASSLDINIKHELESWAGNTDDENGSILPFISQRNVLLLDELLPVYIVFRTPLLEDDTLKSYLCRLQVDVEAYALSTTPPQDQDPKPAPLKERIYSETISDTNQPQIIRREQGNHAYSYVIWKIDVFIARPQGRLHKPVVYFQPTASFKPTESEKTKVPEDDYMPSRVPAALNLLQAFEGDPALIGVHPRLSAMRISKIIPNIPVAKEMIRPIRNGQRPLFRVIPALVWRVRYLRVATSKSDLSLLASLDLEIAQFSTHNVQIKGINLKLNSGKVQTIADPADETAVHRPGDHLTYTYKIEPELGPEGTPALGITGHFLTLNISAVVFKSETCLPAIAIEWKTPVDFIGEQTPSDIKDAYRISKRISQTAKSTNSDLEIQADPDAEAQNTHINITLTVSGPLEVRVGETFTWDVFIVNRSEKTRRLAILVIPKRKRDFEGRPQSSRASVDETGNHELFTSAVVDENAVYLKQKSSSHDTAELICLTTDVRSGSLPPGSCFTSNLRFLALSTGVLAVEFIRVIDLATNETADVRNLPSIISVTRDSIG